MAGEPELDEIEQAVLRIVEQGAIGWHEIEVRLGMIELPRRDYNVLEVLRGLEGLGLVTHTFRTWRVASELDRLSNALLDGPSAMLAQFRPLIEDPAAFDAALRRLAAERPDAGKAIATGVVQLPEPRRSALARELWRSPDLKLRRAMYEVLAPAHMDHEGRTWQAFPDTEWDECIAHGLADTDASVRGLAAAMVYGTSRGERFAATLVDNLARAGVSESSVILHALGRATDAASLAALRAATTHANDAIAASARRGLELRRDVVRHPPGTWLHLRDKARETIARDLVNADAEAVFRCAVLDGIEAARAHLRLDLASGEQVAVARAFGLELPVGIEERWIRHVAAHPPTDEDDRRTCMFAATALGAPELVPVFDQGRPLVPRTTTQAIVPMNTFAFARHLAEYARGPIDAVLEPWLGYRRVFPIAVACAPPAATWMDLFWAGMAVHRMHRHPPAPLGKWLLAELAELI